MTVTFATYVIVVAFVTHGIIAMAFANCGTILVAFTTHDFIAIAFAHCSIIATLLVDFGIIANAFMICKMSLFHLWIMVSLQMLS